MHCIPFTFLQLFMHLDVCLYVENCVLIGLDWVEPMMQFILAIHKLMLFSFSPSLSRIDCTWHPSTNPLSLGTLFVSGHLLLILIVFTFDSVMRRPKKTSWRTSPNVVFIRSTAWFYRTFPILLHLLSFIVGDGNLYVRYSWVVPPWSFRSSAPTCMVSIPLYLSLLCAFEVHIS